MMVARVPDFDPGFRKRVISWSFYDWANSAFATTVMAGFFPIFFKKYWSSGAAVTESTFQLGLVNSLGSLLILLIAPILGSLADKGGAKKKFLAFFASMGMVMTGGLYFVAQGGWQIAALLYAFGIIGFSGANVFYDALLIPATRGRSVHFVSALGYALGYLGGGILFAANVLMTLHPQWFGLRDAAGAVRVSFLTVTLWWAVFSIPIFLFVPEGGTAAKSGLSSIVREGMVELFHTFREVKKLPMTFLFLVSYWLYMDGVDTIIRMAVDYGISLGFESDSLIIALLITQFVGFPAAIVFGRLGERFGAKRGIFIALAVYSAAVLWGYFMKNESEFYGLAITIGLVQGGVQSLSRSFYSSLIPANQTAQFFGFYNMMGKFAAILGPVLMGAIGMITGNPRFSIFGILILFILGGFLLCFVNEKKGKEAVSRWKSIS